MYRRLKEKMQNAIELKKEFYILNAEKCSKQHCTDKKAQRLTDIGENEKNRN